MDGFLFGKSLVTTRVTEVKTSAEPKTSLHLSGTVALKGVAKDDPRLQALREACQLAAALKNGAEALTDRSRQKGGKDPMTVVQGCNSLEKAVAEVEDLIRQLDEALAAEAAQVNELQANS
ncbi:MAG: hypothetical protein K8R92_02855 [Planctomycetes bacterium]|nr:hypothetical protein [Planctomycetota bacterium]